MDLAYLPLILLPAVSAFMFPGNGVLLPNDPYIYIGNNLTLSCNLTKYDSVYNSNYLIITRKNDEIIPAKFITIKSTRTIVLRYPITSANDSGNYICKLNRMNGRPEIIDMQSIKVEYEPKPVTEVNCRVYNWTNMTCTWDLGVEFVHPNTMDIKLVWAVAQLKEGAQFECPHQTRTSCSWWEVDGDDSFISDIDYVMGVTIENKATKPTTLYPDRQKGIRVKTSEIVEPAPVYNLRADKNSTCISLSWQHKQVRRDKVYRLDFQKKGDRHWQTKQVDFEEQLALCGLQPHTAYNFSVQCKPRNSGFWSRPTYLAITTEEDVPQRGPMIEAGSYVEMACQSYLLYPCKKLWLYWQPLSTQEANGNITYYRLDYRNLATNTDWETLSITDKQAQLTLAPHDPYSIQIRAATSRGMSEAYSSILIPAKGEKPSIPEHQVEVSNTSSRPEISVTWSSAGLASASRSWRNLTSYTVFWCSGYKIDRKCQTAISSVELPLSEMEFRGIFDDYEAYMFGVAVNAMTYSGETISSGFKWNSCMYTKNTKPDVAPQNVRLSRLQMDSALTVEWDKLTCTDTRAVITSYMLYICPAEAENNCSGSVSSVLVPSTENSYTVHNLLADTRYRVWVNAMSETGVGPSSAALYEVVIDRRLSSGEIAGIVFGAFLVVVVFLTAIILCIRHVILTVKRKYFEPVKIEVPHSLPPLPPIPMPPPQQSPDSDVSSGIYEKIAEDPPSPGSSAESTTGVNAPLINGKWKLLSLKNIIYGTKKDAQSRHSEDSGRGSLSQSADTLLMRLHPSHLRKNKKSKKITSQSESDSGIILDGRGQVCAYLSSNQSEHGSASRGRADKCNVNVYSFHQNGGKGTTVNPYSCVDIVEKMDRDKAAQLVHSKAQSEEDISDKCQGSTLSLPVSRTSPANKKLVDFRAKSADNDLDYEPQRRLSSMKEAREFDSSDVFSEGTEDEHYHTDPDFIVTANSNESKTSATTTDSAIGSKGTERSMNSYIAFGPQRQQYEDGKETGTLNPCLETSTTECACFCHKNKITPVVSENGYVTQDLLVNHVEAQCSCQGKSGSFQSDVCSADTLDAHTLESSTEPVCDRGDETLKLSLLRDHIKFQCRPPNQLFNLPPHFFGSMSSVPVDPARTTEL